MKIKHSQTRIFIWARYGDLGPSSRQRFFQFITALKQDYKVKVNILFANDYLESYFNAQSRKIFPILVAYLRRLLSLSYNLIFYSHDIYWIEKELLPFCPWWLERFFLSKTTHIIDIDDAWYLRYTENSHYLIRKFMANKIFQLIKHADITFAGNNYLLKLATQCGSKHKILMPTTVDLLKYKKSNIRNNINSKIIILGWIGTISSLRYFTTISAALSIVAEKLPQYQIYLDIIGPKPNFFITGIIIRHVIWNEASEHLSLYNIDIGLMPLKGDQWDLGKCAYKLIQYMACAKASVSSRIGANCEVIDDGINGFLADNETQWVENLLKLILNYDLRIEMGIKAYAKVEQNYSLAINLVKIKTQIAKLIKD